jgi:hypothetical protein
MPARRIAVRDVAGVAACVDEMAVAGGYDRGGFGAK